MISRYSLIDLFATVTLVSKNAAISGLLIVVPSICKESTMSASLIDLRVYSESTIFFSSIKS